MDKRNIPLRDILARQLPQMRRKAEQGQLRGRSRTLKLSFELFGEQRMFWPFFHSPKAHLNGCPLQNLQRELETPAHECTDVRESLPARKHEAG